MKYVIFVLLLIGCFVTLYLLVNKPRSTSGLPPPNPTHPLSFVGSIGIGKDKVEPGIASFKENYQKLDELSLYWYNLDSDNTITLDDTVSEEMEKETVAFAKQNSKKVLLGISDHGEAEKADEILDDEDTQSDHISTVISLLSEKGYDGVNIDYEDLRGDQEEAFTSYMRNLAEAVRAEGKILSISVPVETRGRVLHGINITAVSQVVDRMHLVTYEESGVDTGPGPIASIGWVNAIVKNAIDQGVAPSKIVLGTAHSGHDWQLEPEEEFFKDMHTRETLELLARTSATVTWDEEKQQNYFEYEDDRGRTHVVWLEDARSFSAKVDLARRYKLHGVFIWYLGGEDPQLWQNVPLRKSEDTLR